MSNPTGRGRPARIEFLVFIVSLPLVLPFLLLMYTVFGEIIVDPCAGFFTDDACISPRDCSFGPCLFS